MTGSFPESINRWRSAIGMRGNERRRPVGEFVGGVGAEPGYVGAQVGRKGGKLVGGDGPALGDQLADHVHDVQGVMEDDQVGQQGVERRQFCEANAMPDSGSSPSTGAGIGMKSRRLTW